jgi:hypothetical protein
VYLTSLRLRASETGVEAIIASHDEVIVKFDRLPPLNMDQLGRASSVVLKRGSNQLRFARGSGNAWMEHLYALVSALPRMGNAELPDVITPALRSA